MPGPAAERAFNLFLVKLVGAALGAVVAMRVAMTLHRTWVNLVAIALGFAVFWLMLHWLAEVGRRNFEEFKHGYTTLVLQYGMFKSTRDLRWWITNLANSMGLLRVVGLARRRQRRLRAIPGP